MMVIYFKSVFVLLIWLSTYVFISCDTVFTFLGSNATLPCSSSIHYPQWRGPSGNGTIIFNYAAHAIFANPTLGEKQRRLSWGPNLQDLMIKDTILGDKGNYTCIGNGTMDSAELIVIVLPEPPVTSNIIKLEDSREVVNGNEGQSLTITCTSRGGYPAPTVVWYKGNISSSNQMSSRNTGTLQSNGTYTVTLQHTFTPTVSYDRKTLICRSYFPQADSAHRGSKTKFVILYLTLKPSQPTVTQTAVVMSGDTVEVSCRTTGSRPASNISWSYQGSTTKGIDNTTLDATTETFSVVSLFRRKVTAADNGRNVQCVVTHQALVSPPEKIASVKLNVQFSVGPSTTHITGNKEMVATGQTALTLTCTTGSSNPASNITWKNGSVPLTSSRPYRSSSGDNNGIVRSQQLIWNPTRYMDGDVITCSVYNMASQSAVVDSVTLSLKYSPLVTIHGQQQYTLTEGESKQLFCRVDSKPSSTIKWYHGNTMILQETPLSHVLNYSLIPVNRTHYGDHICKANNGIGAEHQKQISITVRFKPFTTVITGNSNIIANGKNTLPLVCTSGSSNPISNITWRINNVVRTPTGSLSDQSGNFGGMKRRRKLTMTPTRDNDGDSISCEAYNSIGSSERSIVTLDIRYRPLIVPMSEVIGIEGNNTVLICVASSKPTSTFKWYKEGQTGVLHQGTGTLDKNKLTYTINKVSRTDAATYRCNADNSVEIADNEKVLLTVYYPPDVKAVTINTTVKATHAVLTCNASGKPNKIYRYGQWIQTWPGYSLHVSERPGSENLELTHLTYEHSGVYTCSASNGIKVFGTDTEYMEGSVMLLVKSFPVIINYSEKAFAKLKENVTLDVYYYTNAAGSELKIFRNINGSRRTGVTYTVSEEPAEVDLPVFTHKIRTIGIRARILIRIQSTDDIGVYDVVVSNEIDTVTRSFEIVPKDKPKPPENMIFEDKSVTETSVIIKWNPGFDGNHKQTFVLRFRKQGGPNWLEITKEDEGTNIMNVTVTGLADGTSFVFQMYSKNSEGRSSFTEPSMFTTIKKECMKDKSALIVGVVLGVVIAVVVIYSISVTTVLRRKYVNRQKEGITEQAKEQMYVNLELPKKIKTPALKKTQKENTTFNDDSENQYTELDKELRDQESAYDAISSM